MKLAFIGIGNVGLALASNLEGKGHEIVVATNDSNRTSVKKALAKNPHFTTLNIQEAIDVADILFLAIPFFAAETLLKSVHFKGKTLIDCTNPVGPGISHGLESKLSGAESIQKWAPSSHVIKAFTIYGFENLANPSFPNHKTQPVMLLAGNHIKSKKQVVQLILDLGYKPLDTGDLTRALHLEHMTLLWVKMVRKDGHHPNFTWAYLERV